MEYRGCWKVPSQKATCVRKNCLRIYDGQAEKGNSPHTMEYLNSQEVQIVHTVMDNDNATKSRTDLGISTINPSSPKERSTSLSIKQKCRKI